MKNQSPAKRLEQFIAKFTPEIATLARAALDRMRELLPGAIEMVYDNYNALVIGFSPTARPSEAIFSIVIYPCKVSLCFLQGTKVPDPQKRLKGDGKQVRHIQLETAEVLDAPAVRDLIARASQCAKVPMDGQGDGELIIKSISAKQRPRRPGRTV
jgi:hypothetical protein